MEQIPTREFAWDGVAFSIPATWELAAHELTKGITRIAMEDETDVRLEIEWVIPRRPVDAETVHQRYLRLTKPFAESAEHVEEINPLPEAWSAFGYTMADGRRLLLATHGSRHDGSPICFVKLHGRAEEAAAMNHSLEQLTHTFTYQASGPFAWHFYDVDLLVDRRLRLVGTALQAGRKFLQFEWRLRRLFLWVFSLADLVTRDHDMAAWCAAYLNDFKGIRGRRFVILPEGGIEARRRWYHLFGHSQEIGRLCWRYRVGFEHLQKRNQILLWVFHYRRESDSILLGNGFAPEKEN